MRPKLRNLTRYPLVIFSASLISALLLAVLIFVIILDPPAKDTRLLILFMSGTGLLTISLAAIFWRLGIMGRLPSMRWAMLAAGVLTILLIFPNVWVTARLMFISQHDLRLTTVLLVFAGLASIAFSFFITTTMVERIGTLSDAVGKLAGGKFDARLDVQGNDEIAQLAKTFNWMAASLEKLDREKQMVEQTRRDLISWVSHDLRTPLASIRVMVEAMADGVVDDVETTARYLETTLTEVQHLNRLINDLFELAQLDAGHFTLDNQPASLCDLISDTLKRISAQAEHRGVTLRSEVDAALDPVAMDSNKIQRVLYNLLDNAIRHTPADGAVTLTATRAGPQQARVQIHNSGSAIANEQLPRIFNSFYRGESSRAQSGDGHRGAGLGLAIARSFVEAHEGQIWVESAAGSGTTFTFTLPRVESPQVRA